MALLTIFTVSCGSTQTPRADGDGSLSAASLNGGDREVPGAREVVPFFKSCNETFPPAQEMTGTIDDLTKRSIVNSPWLKATFDKIGRGTSVLDAIDFTKSTQYVTTTNFRCGSGSYVSRAVFKLQYATSQSEIRVEVDFKAPQNALYDYWWVDGITKVSYVGTSTINNVDNGGRISDVRVTGYVADYRKLFLVHSAVGSNITSTDPSIVTGSTSEIAFIANVDTNTTEGDYRGDNLKALRIVADKGKTGITSQSLSAQGINVIPTDPGCPVPNPYPSTTQLTALGTANLSTQTILVCPIIDTPYLYDTEPGYYYASAKAVCLNEYDDLQTARKNVLGAKIKLFGLSLGASGGTALAIVGAPTGFAILVGGTIAGASTAGLVGEYVIYEGTVIQERKYARIYNECLQRNRSSST